MKETLRTIAAGPLLWNEYEFTHAQVKNLTGHGWTRIHTDKIKQASFYFFLTRVNPVRQFPRLRSLI